MICAALLSPFNQVNTTLCERLGKTIKKQDSEIPGPFKGFGFSVTETHEVN